jgi:hypothetical protein
MSFFSWISPILDQLRLKEALNDFSIPALNRRLWMAIEWKVCRPLIRTIPVSLRDLRLCG